MKESDAQVPEEIVSVEAIDINDKDVANVVTVVEVFRQETIQVEDLLVPGTLVLTQDARIIIVTIRRHPQEVVQDTRHLKVPTETVLVANEAEDVDLHAHSKGNVLVTTNNARRRHILQRILLVIQRRNKWMNNTSRRKRCASNGMKVFT